MSFSNRLFQSLKQIKEKKPLVLNLTNHVAMDLTANALLALGASPIMSFFSEELKELVSLSHSLVINLGTLDRAFIASAHLAMQESKEGNKPVVLDPVGAGATQRRTETARDLLRRGGVSVLRGNASEIAAVFGEGFSTKGVDSTIDASSLFPFLEKEATAQTYAIAISGKTDFIFHSRRMATVSNGTAQMSQVTAMGCTASALTGAFLGIGVPPFEASLFAFATMGIAGEKAEHCSRGPGSFRVNFIDALASLKEEDFHSLKVEVR